MSDQEIIDAIMLAEDKSEQYGFSGNFLISLEISSATVGKKATFYYGPDGGNKSFVVSDV